MTFCLNQLSLAKTFEAAEKQVTMVKGKGMILTSDNFQVRI